MGRERGSCREGGGRLEVEDDSGGRVPPVRGKRGRKIKGVMVRFEVGPPRLGRTALLGPKSFSFFFFFLLFFF
jgi:hypothetical protein